jgi:FkbM family methyltransferase
MLSRNSLRRVRHAFRAIAGTDVYARAQPGCPRVYLGNENAAWCICPAGLSEDSIVYSFGVGEDISFDLALIRQFGMRVHAFDPTPRSVAWMRRQQPPEKFFFHDYGVGPHDGSEVFHPPDNPSFVSYTVVARGQAAAQAVEAPVYRLRTIMKLLGHEAIDLLKMDIEGAEYEVIADLITSGVKVRQLLVEFHHRWREVGAKKTRKAIRDLNQAGFRIFNVSPTGSEYSFLLYSGPNGVPVPARPRLTPGI